MRRSDVRAQWEHTDEEEKLVSGDIDWDREDGHRVAASLALDGMPARPVKGKAG